MDLLKGIETLSGEVTVKLFLFFFCLPSEKESPLKGKNLLPEKGIF